MQPSTSFTTPLLLAALFAMLLLTALPFGSRSATHDRPGGDTTRAAAPPVVPLRAQQDSMLRQFPFLRQLRYRDSSGRLLDLYGRPVPATGC